MMRRLGPGRLVIASHNRGKIPEIAELLGPHGIEPVSAIDLDLPEPEEIGTTFVDNAMLKARAAADLSGLPAIADDSGLCVDALGGRPGIYSARWAERSLELAPDADPGEAQVERDFGYAMQRVHDELVALGPDLARNAHFVCALAVCWPEDGQRRCSKAASMACSSGRHGARRASATTRCSSRSATTRPSARWSRPRSTP
jgi:XTP/dITP diphosphohydrolase